MEQLQERVAWATRVNIRPLERELMRALARAQHISVATMIGIAIENYVTPRSSS